MDNTAKFSTTLSETSIRRFYNPFQDFSWPDFLESDKLTFSRSLSVLNYLGESNTLSPEQEEQFFLLECTNFFSLNIQGEKALISGIASRLHGDYPGEVSRYLHHFIDEENKHMSVFSEFCRRYGERIYGGRQLNFGETLSADTEDLLFFTRVVIFEEIADYYNKIMMADGALDSTVRAIHRMHHQDESRHLAFGRAWIGELYQRGESNWDNQKKIAIAEYLTDYIEATWREYYNPYFLRDAGIEDAYTVSRQLYNHEDATSFRHTVMAPCMDMLRKHGFLI